MEIRFSSDILLIVNIILGLGFLGFRILVIVLEFIVPDEFFTVHKLGLKIKDKRTSPYDQSVKTSRPVVSIQSRFNTNSSSETAHDFDHFKFIV